MRRCPTRRTFRAFRDLVATERGRWHAELDALKLQHTPSAANFVFLNTRKPHDAVATALRQQGIVVARAFPPYDTWVRITIGTPQENSAAQSALVEVLRHNSAKSETHRKGNGVSRD